MLLELRFKNCYHMVNETKISLVAEALSEHKYSLLGLADKPSLKVLPIKLFYGPAGVEKHKIIVALKLMQMLISDQVRISPNLISKLAHIPTQPVHMGVTVAADNCIYDYDISFLANSIVHEAFRVNGTTLFDRNGNAVRITKTPKALSCYDNLLRKHLELTEKLFESKGNHMRDQLFLTSFFSCFVSPDILNPFLSQICNKLIFFDDSKLELARRKRILSQSVHGGIDSRVSSPTQDATMIAKLMLQHCIDNGICLVIGEHMTSLDPLEIIPFLKALHNINRNYGGQLLMFTYQPLYMHKQLIRRDEVCFLHKERDSLLATNLSQYAPRVENYMRKYLDGEYLDVFNYRTSTQGQESY